MSKSIIFPPRPKSAIPPTELDYYESSGKWLAQYKYNGQRNLIHIKNNKVAVYGRQGKPHLTYSLPNSVRDDILALPGLNKNIEYWLDSELLTKTSALDTKNKIVLYDVLQIDKYLFLKNQVDRLLFLDKICGSPIQLDVMRGMAYQVSENILMAPTFESDFTKRFKEKVHFDECEGLLLRKRMSSLDNFGQKEYEVGWMVRCRKVHKNYNF